MKQIQSVKLFLGVLLLWACSPKVDQHGYVSSGDWKEKITIGQTTKDEVLAAFGSPSAQNNFGGEAWYYISSRQETVAFLKPEIAEQNVVRVEFDQAGVVSNVQAFDKASGKEFDLVKRVTPTEGHSMTMIEQFLGNIGRFNNSRGSDGSIAPGGRQGR